MNQPAIFEGVQKLEARLKGSDHVFTIGDAAAVTGYRTDEAKQLLDTLMAKYDCRLKITENGDLIYDFGQYLHPRGERTWAEWWYGAKKWLWAVFVFVFKIWIAVTLVVYFAIFVIILIAVIIAMNSSSDSDSSSSDSGIGDIIGALFRGIFIWNTHTTHIHYETDSRGYSYQSYDSNVSPLSKLSKKKSKDFTASVYDFVFGPARVEVNALANQQEVASYLRANKGVIITPEVVALGGWTGDKAEDFFSEVVVRYQGDAKISENQILYGDFTELARSKSNEGDAPIVWYWDEYEPEYKLTGNTWWRNFWVCFMNLFNLIFATIFVAVTMDSEIAGEAGMGAIGIGLGWVPFTFSMLFFAVPIMRWFQLQPLQNKRRMENIRKRLMKVIYNHPTGEISLAELERVVNQAQTNKKGSKNIDDEGVEKLLTPDISRMMNQMIIDFYGEIDSDQNGNPIYRFVRLREEKEEIQHIRAKQDTSLGNVIYDSHE